MIRKLLTSLVAVAVLLGVAACSTPTASAEGGTPAVAVGKNTVVVDVRTPGEYASGHLEGAVLLDLNGGEFARALPGLNADAKYLVYCRSGSRSGQAVAMMEQRGMGDVTDLGAMEHAAAATGLSIVTG